MHVRRWHVWPAPGKLERPGFWCGSPKKFWAMSAKKLRRARPATVHFGDTESPSIEICAWREAWRAATRHATRSVQARVAEFVRSFLNSGPIAANDQFSARCPG